MADKVHLTKHGIQALGWGGEVGQYAERKIPTALEVLRCACHIDADVTLGHRPCGRARSGTRPIPSGVRLVPCRRAPFGGNHPISRQFDLVYLEIARSFEWDA